MNTMICHFWPALLLLFGLVKCAVQSSASSSTILCYECNSALNSMCSEKVLPESLKRNCSDHDRGITHTLCRKIVQHVDYEINGHVPVGRVIRSCGWDETKYKGACYHRSGYGGHQEVCSCTKDLCNGSQGLAYTSIALIVSATLFFASNLVCC